jgi:hypothetical protein
MRKLFTFSVVEEDSSGPTEPIFSVGPEDSRRSIVLTRAAFEWFTLYKKFQNGENVDKPKRLAGWMYVTGKRDEQLAVALGDLFEAEIARMCSVEEYCEVLEDSDAVPVIGNFLALSDLCEANDLLIPGGPAAQALASSGVNLDRAFHLIDSLRSYLLSLLTSTEGVDWQPLADVRLSAAEGIRGPTA